MNDLLKNWKANCERESDIPWIESLLQAQREQDAQVAKSFGSDCEHEPPFCNEIIATQILNPNKNA